MEDTSGSRTKIAALIMILVAEISWSIAPVLIRYVKDSFPAVFQSFFRYFISLIVLWVVYRVKTGPKRRMADRAAVRSLIPKLFIVAVANYVFQISFTVGFYLVFPIVGTLVGQTQVIFAVFLAMTFFADERSVMRRLPFILGLIMALAGVMMTILGGQEFGTFEFNIGVLVLILSAASWSLLGTLVRKWLGNITPMFGTASVFSIVTPLFLVTYIAMEGFTVPDASVQAWLILIISGLIGIGLGHAMYYGSVPSLGVSLAAVMGLTIPLFTSVVSYLVFRETLTWLQIAGGAVLLAGCYSIVRVRFRT